MEFGYCIENFDTHLSPNNLIENAKKLEDAGFDHIWTTDHIMQTSGGRLPIYDKITEAVTTLSFLAGFTSKIKLGISTLVLPIRNPILVAKQISSINYLSTGRVIMSFAVGWNEQEFNNLNSKYRTRGKRMNEYLELITNLWNEVDSFGDESTEFNFKNVAFEPSGNIPLYISGNSEHAIKRAIKFGIGWHPSGGITGQRIRELLDPYDLPAEFKILARKSITDQDIGEIIDEYKEYNIDGIVFDLSRNYETEKWDRKFQELISLVKD